MPARNLGGRETEKKYFKKIFGYNLQSKVLIKQDAGVPLVLEGDADLEELPEVEISSKS